LDIVQVVLRVRYKDLVGQERRREGREAERYFWSFSVIKIKQNKLKLIQIKEILERKMKPLGFLNTPIDEY